MSESMAVKAPLIQNLEDAGCSQDFIKDFLKQQGNKTAQINLLSKQRKLLLEKMHIQQKRIDCLDYLIYQIKHINISF